MPAHGSQYGKKKHRLVTADDVAKLSPWYHATAFTARRVGVPQRVGGGHKARFSAQEESWLRQGVAKYGAKKVRWAEILASYAFDKSRTTKDLAQKWNNMSGKA